MFLRSLFCPLLAVCLMSAQPIRAAGPLTVRLRYQQETSPGSGRFHRLQRIEHWHPHQSAIIVCDMWDLHHCKNAVRRERQFAPRLNEVLKSLRSRGVTIIHAPSSCMAFYADHPARLRAQRVPSASSLPDEINSWCHQISAEEQGDYPIDQSDGGEDDDPQEHAAWAAHLQDIGRNPRKPWKRQIDLIDIDPERDFITDQGEETWNILQNRGIENVILAGVHTNMCVLGRPFGLRQMAKNGKHVVLMRDMTDTMYNPASPPYVSHFSGTDLIIDHIEKYVCPTITSDQFLTHVDQPFVFAKDTRPHLVIVMAEDEYDTKTTLPKFAQQRLQKDFRISYVHGSETKRNDIPGLEVLDEADALLVSIRRRVLPRRQMQAFRRFVASGKPVIGIRTASHAFSLRNQEPPQGYEDWPSFDADVWGGNYHNHHGNKKTSTIYHAPGASGHEILIGVEKTFPQTWSLYKTSPLKPNTKLLLLGKLDEEEAPAEPVAWTFHRADGGRSFYTSLGHVKDFERKSFPNLLENGIRWAVGKNKKQMAQADH